MKICTRSSIKINPSNKTALHIPVKNGGDATCVRMPNQSVVCQDIAHGPILPPVALGDEKELALLFLDIRNFTAFMESRSAYDVIYVIRQLFILFGESIKEAGGRIVETAGDSIYAVFGMESNIKDAVQASVNTASAIFHDLEIFNTTYARPYFNLSFEIGIGLHHGKVIVGEFNMDYNAHMTVMGLPVNIASRLQTETKSLNNNLLMSEAAYQLLDNFETTPEQRTVRLNGISAPVQVRLMGQPYNSKTVNKPALPDNLDYYIAMAG
jgi:adenylate cyclase